MKNNIARYLHIYVTNCVGFIKEANKSSKTLEAKQLL